MLRKIPKSKWSAEEFNKLYPVGTAVRYYPVGGTMHHYNTTTRSEAWELGHGEPVVSLENYSGGKALSHIEIA